MICEVLLPPSAPCSWQPFTLALVIGISLGIGWVLALFLPLSLFEGTLLGMIAAAITGRLWSHLWFSSVPFPKVAEEKPGAGLEDEIDQVPESKFWRTSEERTRPTRTGS